MRDKLKSSTSGQVVVFFVLAFVIGWTAFLPVVLHRSMPVWSTFVFLFSPALAGLITSVLIDGIAGAKSLFARYLRWNARVSWYVVAVLLIPAIFTLVAVVQHARNVGSLLLGSPWYFVIAAFGWLMIINSGEEIGWRGFALPRLQRVVKSPLIAAVILGALWGLWHLPLYLDPRQAASFPFPLFMAFIVGLSVIYSVVFNNTGGSLLLAVLLHASTDIPPRFLRIAAFTPFSWSVVVALVWVAATVLYLLTRRAQVVTD